MYDDRWLRKLKGKFALFVKAMGHTHKGVIELTQVHQKAQPYKGVSLCSQLSDVQVTKQ